MPEHEAEDAVLIESTTGLPAVGVGTDVEKGPVDCEPLSDSGFQSSWRRIQSEQ